MRGKDLNYLDISNLNISKNEYLAIAEYGNYGAKENMRINVVKDGDERSSLINNF